MGVIVLIVLLMLHVFVCICLNVWFNCLLCCLGVVVLVVLLLLLVYCDSLVALVWVLLLAVGGCYTCCVWVGFWFPGLVRFGGFSGLV